MDFLKTLKIPSPVFPNDSNKLSYLSGDASIAEGFQTLISNNILSVPLYDEKAHAYIGSLSMLDVVLHALDSLNDTEIDSVSFAINSISDKEAFRHSKAKDVAGKARQTPPIITNSNATIDEVVELMVRTKAHHVLGLNDKGELSNVITQSRIVESVSMLFGIDPVLTALGEKTVQELNMGLREVLHIKESAKASDAFRLLADNHVSGVAVVKDGSKTLIGNISVRDLRVIKGNASFLRLLALPVGEFIEAVRSESIGPKSVVSCGVHDTYRAVMERIVSNKVHRCYVVDNNNELLGVVSLWDLLSKLVSFSSVNAP